MLFRKSVQEKIDDVLARIRVRPDCFSEVPGTSCRIDASRLRYSDGSAVALNFPEAQLLTSKLSKDNGLTIRLPTLNEDYSSFQGPGREDGHQYEWKAEFLDGSFLMLNPSVSRVDHSRKYDFHSPSLSLVNVPKYSIIKDNGDSCWFGISQDEYGRAAFVSSSYKGGYSAGAIPPLSRDCLGVRLLIDEK